MGVAYKWDLTTEQKCAVYSKPRNDEGEQSKAYSCERHARIWNDIEEPA